jgi:hypothetical protein
VLSGIAADRGDAVFGAQTHIRRGLGGSVVTCCKLAKANSPGVTKLLKIPNSVILKKNLNIALAALF